MTEEHFCRKLIKKNMLLMMMLAVIKPVGHAAIHQVSVDDGVHQTIDGSTLGVMPGDTIEVLAGNYAELSFQGIRGNQDNRVTIINKNGQVHVENSDRNSAISLQGCQYVRLTGTGDAGVEYGFAAACTRSGRHTINVVGGSSVIEIDHIEVFGAGFAGFNVKDEPSASGTYNRGNFLMEGIELHHNYVHDTGGEGFYVGHTFYNGYDINGTLYYPHLISGLRVYHNHTLRTGAEGIQVGSTIAGMEVSHNLVEFSGIDPFANFQDNGIQIGMSSGWVIGNTIRDAAGNGIIVLAQGDNVIASNVIERPGSNGMFVDDREASPESIAAGGVGWGPGYCIFNNTIVNPGQDSSDPVHNRSGIRLYAKDLTETNHVYNNLAIGIPGGEDYAVSLLSNEVPMIEEHTVFSADGNGLGLTDIGNGNYQLQSGSSLINAGRGIQQHGVFEDAAGDGRCSGSAPDVGAFEFQEPIVTDPIDDSTADTFIYPYRLYTPPSSRENNPLPLVIFLHGVGARGTDNTKHVENHIQPLIDTVRDSKYCAYLLAPQNETGFFNGNALVGLIQEVIANHPVDTARVYVTGLSAGGQGTWEALANSPDLFAAGVPLSAVQVNSSVETIASNGIPIWAFHGDADSSIDVSHTRNMINQLEGLFLKPRYTEILGNGHNGWSNIYGDSAEWTDFFTGGDPSDTNRPLYPWLFRQQNTKRQSTEAEPRVAAGSHFLIDCGNAGATDSPDSSNSHWISLLNGMSVGPLASKVVDRTGTLQPLSIDMKDPFDGNQTGGVVDDSIYPTTAQQDTFWSGAFDINEAPNTQAVIVFGGLPPEALCKITVFASRTGDDTGRGRLGRYSIGEKYVDLDASDNTNQTAILEQITADENGELEFKITVSPDGGARFAYLGVLELEVLNNGPSLANEWSGYQ